MSNYAQDSEEDEQFQSAIFPSHSSNGSPINTGVTEAMTDGPAPAPSKKKRNLPGNPGKEFRSILF